MRGNDLGRRQNHKAQRGKGEDLGDQVAFAVQEEAFQIQHNRSEHGIHSSFAALNILYSAASIALVLEGNIKFYA
mgnify:CR=1 FL=1